jgi:hypothetical protein
MQLVMRFCSICGLERDVPAPLLDGMEQAPGAIARAIEEHAGVGGGGWTPREVIAHLADSEITFGWRIRQILTEYDPLVAPYDEEQWAEDFRYGERDAAVATAAFAAVRAANVELLRGIGDAAWRRTYRQEQSRRTLEELVRHRADHDLQHLRQISGGAR